MNPRDLVRFPERQEDNVGFAYIDFTEDEGTPYVRRALIMEGPSSLVAYIGVPIDHRLAGKDYGDFPLDVHGGLTFSGEGDGKRWPLGWYWYGWDYGHAGDYTKLCRKFQLTRHPGDHEWTIPEVLEHVNGAMHRLRTIMEYSHAAN